MSVVVSPAANYLIVTATTITVDPSLIIAANIGTNAFTLSGTLVDYPLVQAVDINFNVSILASTVCNVVSLKPIKTALTLSKYSYSMGG